MIKDVTEKEFDAAVSTGLVLVDCWAPWCTGCKMMSNILDKLSQEKPELNIVKVDVDAEKALASRLKVGTLPFLIIYKDGEVVNTITGVQTKARLLSALEG
jgi:thioredoxin 1